ncbi:DsbA family protein [Patescibacteria group bacterium]|nr:DsbA family protein [Patescibacteria group bacterium]
MDSKNSFLTTPVAVIIGAIIISLAILIAGGIIKLGSKSTANVAGVQVENAPPTLPQAQPTVSVSQPAPIATDDHLRGNPKAKVIMVEYSDLECPFCKQFHQTATQAMSSYKADELAWIFRHFPLDQLHSKARKEAEAVECATDLGGNDSFWKLVDKIYGVTPSNNGLNLDDLPNLAASLGLDSTKFKTCLDSDKFTQKIEDYSQAALKAGIQGTPTVFLFSAKSGEFTPVPRAVFYEDLKAAIDLALKS